MTNIKHNAAEFFAGMGLVRMALEAPSVGPRFGVAYANDIDPNKERIYRRLFPEDSDHFDPRDIALVRQDDIPRCELWTASFPCTDLSLAGGRRGIHGGQSGAVWKMLQLLADTAPDDKPRHLFFENVPGLLSSNAGADFRSLVTAIKEQGFGVDVLRVDASHFTPQSRVRLFLIATQLGRADTPPTIDPQSLAPTDARPQMILDAMRAAPDLIWHARDLPPLPTRTITLEQIVEDLPADSPLWWSDERAAYFEQQIHPGHLDRVAALRQGESVTHVTAFRRVRAIEGAKRSVAEIRFDGVAGCLRTPKGGSAKQILVQLGLGDLHVRHLTARECFRLQGVDADPPADTSEHDLLFALGDAVCVPAVRWALDQLDAPSTIATLADVPSRSAPASSIALAAS